MRAQNNLMRQNYEFLFLLGDNVLFCPSISQQTVEPQIVTAADVRRCPNGKELMINATIPVTYIGGGPYIVRKGGKVGLGHGSYMAAIEILSMKFGFKPKLTQARSVLAYIGNVRSYFQLIFPLVM